ncbi:MAG: tripartite tricarboxylate transporter substrate binding protein [Candidatus Accumulibacter sp.]|jgi:tripartite-type tricarboxylate transporter receptor subunit TctC|nr:tripartite tricarboxylate transporter substrate binding protein [Accumulibacter sp.]
MGNSIRLGKALIVASIAATSVGIGAQTWPTQPVRFVVPTTAGSSVDVVARLVAEKLGGLIGQTVIVDDKGGAGGTIGADAVVKARDGHTFLLGYNGPVTVAPALFAKLPYDPRRDLTPIVLAVTQPNVLAVRADLGVDSVQDLVALARSRPDRIDYASVGNGSLSHLAMELLKMRSEASLLHIPFTGGPAAVLALGRGDVQVLFSALSNVQPLVREGKAKLLAVSNAKRSAALPDLPTVAEEGYPGFDATTWNGFLAPANTPKEVILKLNQAINQVLEMPEVKQKLLAGGAEVAGGTPEQFGDLLSNETAAWAEVIKRSGIKVD